MEETESFLDQLPPKVSKLFRAKQEKGEQILWVGKPVLKLVEPTTPSPLKSFFELVGIIGIGIGLLVWTIYTAIHFEWNLPFLSVIPELLVFLLVIFAVIQRSRIGQPTPRYILTNKMAYVTYGDSQYKMQAYYLFTPKAIEIVERAENVADFIFDGDNYSQEFQHNDRLKGGFIAAPDAKHLNALIREVSLANERITATPEQPDYLETTKGLPFYFQKGLHRFLKMSEVEFENEEQVVWTERSTDDPLTLYVLTTHRVLYVHADPQEGVYIEAAEWRDVKLNIKIQKTEGEKGTVILGTGLCLNVFEDYDNRPLGLSNISKPEQIAELATNLFQNALNNRALGKIGW